VLRIAFATVAHSGGKSSRREAGKGTIALWERGRAKQARRTIALWERCRAKKPSEAGLFTSTSDLAKWYTYMLRNMSTRKSTFIHPPRMFLPMFNSTSSPMKRNPDGVSESGRSRETASVNDLCIIQPPPFLSTTWTPSGIIDLDVESPREQPGVCCR